MVAAILLLVLIVSGVGLLTGLTYRLLEPLPAWAAHRAVGLAFSAMVGIHILVLYFDKYIGFSFADLLVPFHSGYRPVAIGSLQLGSVYVALGVLALYAIAIIILSSHFWMQKKPRSWHTLHYLSYFVLASVFIHGLFLGTDLKNGVVKALWFAAAFILVVSIMSRLKRAHTIGDD